VGVALDDFGVGYFPFASVRNVPIAQLKTHARIADDAAALGLVASIGRHMAVPVVAQTHLACDGMGLVQGDAFAPAMSLADIRGATREPARIP
jgi:EAL domain-containing protein (putative c-di-GMP-specific phosphodiesterase class I)